MELERRYIERRDFSQARRGYDPDEVDRHLQLISDAVEELKRSQPREASLAGAAASRVEAIITAAESSAREIEEKAQADARAMREQAERDAAERIRGAEEMVERLLASGREMQAQAEDVIGRIGALQQALDAARQGSIAAPEPVAELPAAEEDAPAAPQIGPVVPETPEPEPAIVQEATTQARAAGADGGRASEGARLIALNMALSGAPRDETARYLRENFDLEEQDELLDEVYARAGS